ncbi:hypothetical protein Q8F55_001864 [Vanrija albida]|uniref:Uncharacterized protein n=1 Tax=Vanrija albida TaxID=181172 RepID=A0ABR3Q872_9TREE
MGAESTVTTEKNAYPTAKMSTPGQVPGDSPSGSSDEPVPPYSPGSSAPGGGRREDGTPAPRHQPGAAVPEVAPTSFLATAVLHGSSAAPTVEPPITSSERAMVAEIVTKASWDDNEVQSWDTRLNDRTHTELRTGQRQVKRGDVWHTERYTYTVSVQDFDFSIDASPPRGNSANIHVWTVPDGEPAHRGTHSKAYGGPREDKITRIEASGPETRSWNDRLVAHTETGLAPWLHESRVHKFDAESRDDAKGSALQQWCEAYCADKAKYKRFVLKREVWGWDFEGIKKRIVNMIKGTGYNGAVSVGYSYGPNDVIVRPNSHVVRAMHGSYRWALYLTGVWCCLKGWQRLDKHGGAPYEVVTASYGMRTYPPLPGTYPDETLSAARDRFAAVAAENPEIPGDGGGFLVYGPKGVHYQLGETEDEFLSRVGPTIISRV